MRSLWIGAAGMFAGSTALDIVGHNLANVNTPGFRAGRPSFRDELSTRILRPALADADGLPQVGTGVNLAAVLPDPRQGALQTTGDPHHLAVEGSGYFRVRTPDGRIVYTRDGTFTADAERRIVHGDGNLLLDDDDDPVELPPWTESFTVAPDGTVTAEGDGNRQEVAAIGVALFANPAGLASLGDNLFAATPASGAEDVVKPGEDGAGILRQGVIESSNVDVAAEMVAMILAQRSFQLNARVVQTSDEMMALANQLIR
ncbi:MAG TPA: flagellar hook-basal body protein [Bacillota bacterium]